MKKRNLQQTSQPLLSRPLFVLIGDNNSGKTSFQRYLIEYLCDVSYKRLPRDSVFEVRHPRAPRNFATIACANRSYQERRSENGSIENYIFNVVPEADVTIVASHAGGLSDIQDIEQILKYGRRRYYNVAAVFFDNALSKTTADVAELHWQERLLIRNPPIRESDGQEERIQEQLHLAATQFGDLLLARAVSL